MHPQSGGVVIDNPEHSRFDLFVDDDHVGILAYRVVPGTTVVLFLHTVVTEEFGDHGWAAVLARGALDIVRTGNLQIWPVCSYVRRFIGANTDYLDLVADKEPVGADPELQVRSTITGA